MIEVTDVVRTFGPVRALDGVQFTVARGETFGMLGHNGAGKTTTVRLVAGLLAPDAGQVRVDGLDPVGDGARVRRRLGVLPANAAVDDRMSARANLRFTADLYDLPRRGLDARIEAVLDRFDLAGRADERVGGYSTGMRQRLSLARALLHEPDVLLLDEPTASLDPVAARQVRGIIADLGARDDRTVVLCTHDLTEAQRLCDRVAIFQYGRVVAIGTPEELAADFGGASVLVEVDAQDTATAAAVVPPGAASVTVEGPGTLRWANLAPSDVPEMVAALVAAGARIHAVTAQTPSLEDVYLSLHTATPAVEVPR